MKTKILAFVFAAFFIILNFCAAVHASAVNSCPLVKASAPFKSSSITKSYPLSPMGGALPDAEKRTRKYKIAYHTKGLEYENVCQRDRRLAMIDQYIVQLKASYPHLYLEELDPLLEAYRAHAYEMVSLPGAYGDAIDQCFTETLQRWSACKGRFARTAREMKTDAKKLRVQAMTSIFFVRNSTGGNIWAAGMASTDAKTMFATTSLIAGNTRNAPYINTFKNLVCWEMGNNFALNMGYYANSLKGEIGFQSPCKHLKK